MEVSHLQNALIYLNDAELFYRSTEETVGHTAEVVDVFARRVADNYIKLTTRDKFLPDGVTIRRTKSYSPDLGDLVLFSNGVEISLHAKPTTNKPKNLPNQMYFLLDYK